jgi:hypothetical protein
MATNYTQWVIPVQSSYGLFKITINRDNYDFNIVNTDRCVLSPACTFVKEVAPYSMKYNEEELLVTVDLNSLGFLDRYDYKGTVDGVDTGWVDLKSEGLTLLNLIFDDPDVLYTVWVSFDNNGTWEHFFNGEIKTNNIEWNNNFIEGERTLTEIKTSVIKVPVSSMVERLKQSTIADLTATIDETDCGNSVKAAFYGGFRHAATPNGQTSYEIGLSDNESDWNDFLYQVDSFDTFDYTGDMSGLTFPQGNWGITFDTILSKICELVGYDYTLPNPATDATLRLFDAAWNDGTQSYDYDFGGGVTSLAQMYMNYNVIFGFDTETGLQTLTSPVTYALDDTLDQVIKDICLQFGLIMEFTIEQSGADEGKPRLNLYKRRGITAATMPTNWRILSDASQKPRDIRAKSVRAKYIGDEDVVMTPLRSDKEPFDIELRWRIHSSWGDADGIVRNHNLVYNSNFAPFNNGQKPTWWTKDNGFVSLHADGWVGGAHIFLRQTTTTNQHYPPAWDAFSQHYSSATNWSGYYTFGLCQYIDDTTTRSSNVLSVIAQLTANEMLQDRIVVERTYGGILDDTGSILTVKPRMTFDINSTEYRVIELEIDIIEGSTKTVSITKPADMNTLAAYPVYYITDNATSIGGSGGGGGTNNGGNPEGLWVALYPNSSIRNKVIPTGDAYEALMLRQYSVTHSADLFQNLLYDNTVVTGFNEIGNLFFEDSTFRITFAAPTLTQDNNYTLPVDYPSVTGYVLSCTTAGVMSWVVNGSGVTSPAGANTEIQYNASGVFGASPAFTFATGGGAALVTIGVASTSLAAIRFYNSTNANHVTIGSGVTGTTWALTLPLNAGVSGRFLQTNGSGVTTWAAATTGAAGNDTEVQYNNSGAFAGDSGFTYNSSTNFISLGVASSASGGVIFKNATNANTITMNAGTTSASWVFTLPTTDGNSGEFLQTNGSGVTTWATVTATPAGADTQVQYNNAGAFGAESAFTYDQTTNTLGLGVASTSYGILLFRNDTNADTVSIQAGVTTGSYTLTLPVDDGTNNYVLKTNGSGVTSWVDVATVLVVGTDTQVIFNDTGVLAGDAGFLFNKTTDALTLGVASSTTGSIIFKNATNANTLTLLSGVTGTSYSLTLPTTAGTNNYVLTTNGSGVTTWTNATTLVTPAGANTNIQYNNSGAFGAEAAFSYNAGTNKFILGESASSAVTIDLYNASNTNILTLSGGVTGTTYTFTFPLNAGTNNYVLITNGSGTTSWVAVSSLITGLLYWTEATNTAAPNATIPVNSWTPITATTHGDVAIVPKGSQGSFMLNIPDNAANGGNKRGNRSVDLMLVRTNATEVVSGQYSFGVGHSNTVAGNYSAVFGLNNLVQGDANVVGGSGHVLDNSNSYNAVFGESHGMDATHSVVGGKSHTVGGGADYSAVFGEQHTVSNVHCFTAGYDNELTANLASALGSLNAVSGQQSFAVGFTNILSGTYSVAVGREHTLSGDYSFSSGYKTLNDIQGARSHSAGVISVLGDAQIRDFVVSGLTTGTTQTELLSGGIDQLILPNYGTWTFHILVTCRLEAGNGAIASYEIKGCVYRDANAASTAIAGTPVVTILYESNVALDATVGVDTTNGALTVLVTGLAATNLIWVARVTTVEVIGEGVG